ncbi:hypothetical protein VTN77DRAFT_8480 [Rasamsonia byssochlamydoides]|uniref:uncharacterized protein n=1 Tax=Rasamsonia byssochlamydoides TaxID=89139 RepID=UPI0037426E87
MADRRQHATRRKQLAHLFFMSTIVEYEQLIGQHVQLCMDLIAAQGRAGLPSNLYDWWHYLSMDIVCDLSFGLTFNTLRDGAKKNYVKDLYGSLTIEPVRWHFGWLNKVAAWAPIRYVREAEACSRRAFSRGVQIVQEYKASPGKKRRKDLLQKLLDAVDEKGHPLSRRRDQRPSHQLHPRGLAHHLIVSHLDRVADHEEPDDHGQADEGAGRRPAHAQPARTPALSELHHQGGPAHRHHRAGVHTALCAAGRSAH